MVKQKVNLEWEEAQVDYPVPEEGEKKSKAKPVIKQFESAESDQKPIVIFIYTNDMRKSKKAKREACEKYMEEVLSDADVAEQLGNCVRLKINLGKLKDSKLKRAYHLPRIAPCIVMFDFTGKYYSRTSSKAIKDVISKLKMLHKKCEKLIKKIEKKNAR